MWEQYFPERYFFNDVCVWTGEKCMSSVLLQNGRGGIGKFVVITISIVWEFSDVFRTTCGMSG